MTAPPDVQRKEARELVEQGKKLFRVALEKLLAKIEAGEGTAADFQSVARFALILGLDRIPDEAAVPDAADELRRAMEEYDSEESAAGVDDPSGFE